MRNKLNIMTNYEQQKLDSIIEKYKKCNNCNFTNFIINGICYICKTYKSGNKIIDDFVCIIYYHYGFLCEFVPYVQFKNVEFIAEGGFSKIYKATWIDGPVIDNSIKRGMRHHKYNIVRIEPNYTVVLKKLNNSKNITSKGLNELKIFYDYLKIQRNSLDHYSLSGRSVSKYFGITKDPITQDVIIIMPYYDSGDLAHYVTKDFYNYYWNNKLYKLEKIALGLKSIHNANIIHRDLHSGNIFFSSTIGCCGVVIGDLGVSKSTIESTDDNNNENYGIIPYMAPEILQGQKYTKASDIYSFGMIMWEFMTGRKPFWDEIHDAELIIKICDGLRPPIVTSAPESYIELMKECWHSDPNKRPVAIDIYAKIGKMFESEFQNPTKIVESSNIGPVTENNPVYKSRPLSRMISSAMSLRSSRKQSSNIETDPFYYYQKNNMASTDKRKFEDEDDHSYNGQSVKRRKSFEKESNEYLTKEIELDINNKKPKYVTREIDLDIFNL